jgi:hypothetical protein
MTESERPFPSWGSGVLSFRSQPSLRRPQPATQTLTNWNSKPCGDGISTSPLASQLAASQKATKIRTFFQNRANLTRSTTDKFPADRLPTPV